MGKKLNNEHGQALLKLAREAIAVKLGIGESTGAAVHDDEALKECHGVFVTLTMKGQLRGCIGYLEGFEPIEDAVRHNAVNAAFNDPRFSPLKVSEFKGIDIEVSVLTEPGHLAYDGAEDLLSKLRPGVDGVIIRSGLHSATFLPQVWDQLPDKEEFLAHLCLKAGLSADAWKKHPLDVLTYEVQYFEERRE